MQGRHGRGTCIHGCQHDITGTTNIIVKVIEATSDLNGFATVLLYHPDINPRRSYSVPLNSMENVTYFCSVPINEGSIIWEIDNVQVRTEIQFQNHVLRGIYIEPWQESSISMLSLSEQARQTNEEFLIRCVVDRDRGTTKGPPYYVRTYGKSSILSSHNKNNNCWHHNGLS